MGNIKRKFTPCYVVVRLGDENPHVLGAYEDINQAENTMDKYNELYKKQDLPLFCEIQPTDFVSL